MNEQPIIEAYAKPNMGAFLMAMSYLLLCIMLFSLFDNPVRYIVITSVILAIMLIKNARNKRKGIPALKIYEDRIEQKFEYSKKYRVFRFEDVSAATMKYEFPTFEMVKLEFKDGSKPVKLQLTNLDVPVDKIYKLIVERVNC
ncbi:MAG: hypothetical protein IKU36_04790 [Bacteroidales bacterium]|nr:hypothetical protein [Bacteroidales bacterium]